MAVPSSIERVKRCSSCVTGDVENDVSRTMREDPAIQAAQQKCGTSSMRSNLYRYLVIPQAVRGRQSPPLGSLKCFSGVSSMPGAGK